ncbi:MAG: hypothetical protein WCX64_05855 [Candidatus Micrarchaeia archaeon]
MARHAFPALLIPALLVFALGFCAANEITVYDFYKLNVTVGQPAQSVFPAGSAVDFSVTASNPEDYLFDGYLVVTQTYGCDTPTPFNVNLSDCDTIVHKTITKARIGAGKTGTFQVSEKIPADARPGTWRIDTYLMMNYSSVEGNYVSYAPKHYFAYNVTGSGSSPKVSILKTKTHVAGGFAQSGPSVPQEGPIRGYVEMKNLDSAAFAGTLEISYCDFDDYMGNCNVSETVGLDVPAGKTFGHMYQITDRLERGIYTILYRVLEGGKEVSEYKNRLIISGKTINIIAIEGSKESYAKDERPQVRVAFTGPYFPAMEQVDNLKANTSVYDAYGKLIYTRTENYSSVKPDEIKVQQYAFKATDDIAGYTVCLDVVGEGASKKACEAFGNVVSGPQTGQMLTPLPTAATPSPQPTKQAATPTATGPAKPGNNDYLLVTALIVAACALVAYFIYRNQKPPIAAAALLMLALLPLAHAVDCPAFQFNYDSNNNGAYDSGEPSLTVRSAGAVYYLPLDTIVTAPGQCSYTYASTVYTTVWNTYTYANHWCRNTATNYYSTQVATNVSSQVTSTGYYTHYVTVSENPITYVETRAFADNTSALTKQIIVDLIKKYTFTDLSFTVNANESIYPTLIASSLPAFTFGEFENDTSKVDNYIMYTVLNNHCSSPANNCTYVNESSAYGVYTYKPFNYFIRSFTINNYTMVNLPINYTHQNGTLMQLRINYTLDNYTINNYSVSGPVSGPYSVNYTLRNYAYTYQVNATNIYSYALPEYSIPAYTINGYVVDAYQNATSYYIKWESLFTELADRGIIRGIVTPTETRTTSGVTVRATNVKYYKILETGVYYLSHTYA